ncbi:hypothetical protein [Rubritalea sp.]|uniref:hypothetical protein n=1 Tax=Rubritalea sp. TaxID=2109375 RepID=UPI003EF4EC7F
MQRLVLPNDFWVLIDRVDGGFLFQRAGEKPNKIELRKQHAEPDSEKSSLI